ncbi:hypothetical protein APA_5072 [Pseudanabaena sp. lw0831]|nr:hypothetical protein APA_5072 [Pseudanabaena sp. lw0831]
MGAQPCGFGFVINYAIYLSGISRQITRLCLIQARKFV